MPEPDLRDFSWTRVMRYAMRIHEGQFMDEMRERREDSGSVSPMGYFDCAILYGLARCFAPKIVVETGGFLGMSSAFILKAMKDAGVEDGRFYAIELMEDIEIGCLIPERLRTPYVALRGPVEKFMRSAVLPDHVDMFLHDSSHRLHHMLMEYRFFWNRMGPGGLLTSHDVNMSGAFPEFLKATYAHDKLGQTDWDKSTHSEWGRWGNVGFVVKS